MKGWRLNTIGDKPTGEADPPKKTYREETASWTCSSTWNGSFNRAVDVHKNKSGMTRFTCPKRSGSARIISSSAPVGS